MKLENTNKTQNPKPQNPLLNSAKPRKKLIKKNAHHV
jgi:hypothetical protein